MRRLAAPRTARGGSYVEVAVEGVRRVIAPLDLDETTIGAARVGLVEASFVGSVEEVEIRPSARWLIAPDRDCTHLR
jgi:hypothetical protein